MKIQFDIDIANRDELMQLETLVRVLVGPMSNAEKASVAARARWSREKEKSRECKETSIEEFIANSDAKTEAPEKIAQDEPQEAVERIIDGREILTGEGVAESIFEVAPDSMIHAFQEVRHY